MKTVKTTKEKYAKDVCDIIQDKIKSSKKENFVIGFSDARSMTDIFSELLIRKIDFKKVHFFLVDEKISKKKDELNFNILRNYFESLVEKNAIKREQVHPFIFTNNLDKDMFEYQMNLTRFSFRFDLILLNAGVDGQIASLFPDHPAVKNSAMGYVHVKDSSNAESVSSSRNFIQESSCAILLFMGQDKKTAFKNFNNKKLIIEKCPAKIVQNIKESYLITDLS